MASENQISASVQKAAALEVMRLIHPEVQAFGFALEGLFLAEVAVDFFSQGDATVVQMDLCKNENEGKFFCVHRK